MSCATVRAFMFISAHGTHHSFILSWSAKGRKMQKKKARNQVCIGFEDLVGTSFHVEGLRVSKIIASTFTRWRVPAVSFPSILNFPLSCCLEFSLHEMKGCWPEWGVWASNLSFWCFVLRIHQKNGGSFSLQNLTCKLVWKILREVKWGLGKL